MDVGNILHKHTAHDSGEEMSNLNNLGMSSKRIQELLNAERKLNALEAGGVDNWEWYDKAIESIRKEDKLEDVVDMYVQDILELAAIAEVSAEDSRNGLYIVNIDEDETRGILQNFLQEYKRVEKE
jgi:hypothetical protein